MSQVNEYSLDEILEKNGIKKKFLELGLDINLEIIRYTRGLIEQKEGKKWAFYAKKPLFQARIEVFDTLRDVDTKLRAFSTYPQINPIAFNESLKQTLRERSITGKFDYRTLKQYKKLIFDFIRFNSDKNPNGDVIDLFGFIEAINKEEQKKK